MNKQAFFLMERKIDNVLDYLEKQRGRYKQAIPRDQQKLLLYHMFNEYCYMLYDVKKLLIAEYEKENDNE